MWITQTLPQEGAILVCVPLTRIFTGEFQYLASSISRHLKVGVLLPVKSGIKVYLFSKCCSTKKLLNRKNCIVFVQHSSQSKNKVYNRYFFRCIQLLKIYLFQIQSTCISHTACLVSFFCF